MPVTPTYPGVYIQEVPSGVRTIVGVATSTAAFVGYFRRGPLDVAVRVFSPGDVTREFGDLHPDSAAGYGLRQFFANGGGEAYVVRVASGAPRAARITLQDESGADVLVAVAGREWRGASVEDPGTWGSNLRVEVDYATRDPSDEELFNLRVAEVETVGGRQALVRAETFANCSTDPDSPDHALAKVNGGSKLVQLSPVGGGDFARPAATGTTGQDPSGDSVANGDTLDVTVNGQTITAALALQAATADLAVLRGALERALHAAGAATPTPNPLLRGARVEVVGGRLRVLAGRGAPGFTGEEVLTFAEDGGTTGAALGLVGGGVVANVQQYVLDSPTDVGFQTGRDATEAADDGDPPDADALRGDFGDKTGMYALRDVDLYNILCLPAAANLGDDDLAAVYSDAITFCEAERAFLLVDIPEGIDDVQQMSDWLDARGIRHRNAAVYFPRLRIPDPLNDNRPRSVAASGTVAGLYARTDSTRGVWKAPAGLEATLRGVQDLGAVLTDQENGVLNPLGINVFRRFPVYGRVAWGARTLDGADALASEWKYVPVRRLALFLEESLYRGLQWAVFEPNDEPLWSQIRMNVGAFMHDRFRQGAFQGTSPNDAYLVKCDSETTTQSDIDQGIVNVVVGFAPLKPAEFVIIRIQQLAGQAQT